MQSNTALRLSAVLACVLALAPGRAAADPAAPKPLDMAEIHERLFRELVSLHESGKLAPRAELEAQLGRKDCALELPAIQGRQADLATLYKDGCKGVVIVGDLRLCGKCGHPHMGGTASGYIITRTGVMVTNYHVIAAEHEEPKDQSLRKQGAASARKPDSEKAGAKAKKPKEPAAGKAPRNAKPVPPAGPLGIGAMDRDGRIHAVKEVLAASKELDIAIVQLDGEGFTPLPVNAEAEVGEPVAIISHPMRFFYMLSTGIVTNHLRLRDNDHDRGPRLCVSAEYGVGSSGAPVFNMKGEVVGMVSSTMPIMTPGSKEQPATEQMVMRYCVPMKDILGLIKKPK